MEKIKSLVGMVSKKKFFRPANVMKIINMVLIMSNHNFE